jgi:hypothetical protein
LRLSSGLGNQASVHDLQHEPSQPATQLCATHLPAYPLLPALCRSKLTEQEEQSGSGSSQLAQQMAEVQRALASLQERVEGSAQQAVGSQAARRDISLLVDAVQVGACRPVSGGVCSAGCIGWHD